MMNQGKMTISKRKDFNACYIDLCKEEKLRPLPMICCSLPNSLDFTTDRVKMRDWGPILNSISLDRSLKLIAIRSRYQIRKPLEVTNSEDKRRGIRTPLFLTRHILESISHSVAQNIRYSESLNSLEFEGIPLQTDCLAVLCLGLTNTGTLRHLSFQGCSIGDNGCQIICQTIANVRSIKSLNLSKCDLTLHSGPVLAKALAKQELILFHDTWKSSLRYREPNLESMSGLRRLTLNDNPHLGDTVVRELIEVIRDSLWLKALDLQCCGITNAIESPVLNLIEHNKTLIVLDLRSNLALGDVFPEEIKMTLKNRVGIHGSMDDSNEYRWLDYPLKDRRKNGLINKTSLRKIPEETKKINKKTTVPLRVLDRTKKLLPQFSVGNYCKRINGMNNVSDATSVTHNRKRTSVLNDKNMDIQAQLQSLIASAQDADEESSSKDNLDDKNCVEHDKTLNSLIMKIQEMNSRFFSITAQYEKLQEETKQKDLEMARTTVRHGQLLDEIQRVLETEMTRREYVEEKLATLENEFLRSVPEFSMSRDESDEDRPTKTHEPNRIKEEIIRRVFNFARKSQSEKVFINGEPMNSSRSPSPLRQQDIKIVRKEHKKNKIMNRLNRKSEGNVPSITSPIYVENNIGDSSDLIEHGLRQRNCRLDHIARTKFKEFLENHLEMS